MKNVLLSIIYCLIVFPSVGQTYTIRGRVVDSTTKDPIPFTTVFINQTTNGAISEPDGSFSITFEQQNAEVVISYVGYEPIIYPIDVTKLNQIYVFELQPKAEVLNEINVKAERDESWYYNFETFKRMFLGESTMGRNCKILNDTTLIIIYDPKSRLLEVKAREPIVIENKMLGYRIEYVLEAFQYDMKQNYSSFAGYPFYKEMKGGKGKKKKWERSRRRAYNGSSMHFLRSLYTQSLNAEKFKIYRLKRVPNPNRPSQREIDSTRQVLRTSADRLDLTKLTKERDLLRRARAPRFVEKLDVSDVSYQDYLHCHENNCAFFFEDYFQIVYTGEKEEFFYVEKQRQPFKKSRAPGYQTSLISITNNANKTFINKFGMTANPLDILYEGYWAYEKLGDMLPVGYKVEE